MLYKERMSYYDIDRRTAQMYAPIDEYLRQTKRFSPRAMKRKYNLGIALYSLFILILILMCIACIVFGPVVNVLIVSGSLAVTIGFVLRHHIKHFGETPHPDMLTCENIIDRDGLENVYNDFCYASDFTKLSRLGRYYVFIKNKTLVRIKDVELTQLIVKEHTDEDGTTYTYHFSIHVRDELGYRIYDLEDLSSSKKKREQRYSELSRAFEARQKGIDTVDIIGHL